MIGAHRSLQAFVAVWLTCAAVSWALEVPFLGGRVNDYANMMSAQAESELEVRLAEFEQRSGSQVAVLTIPTLDGEVLEEYSLRVAETWGLGREGVDDGVLLLIARDDRKMRIEVGYGLEPNLTDAQSGRILRNVMQPRFRDGDFDGGIAAGIDAIVGTLEGADVIPPDSGSGQQIAEPLPVRLGFFAFFLAIIGVFAMSALFSSGISSWVLYFFLMPFFGVFPLALFGPWGGLICLGLWVIGFPIIKFWLRRTDAGKRWLERRPNLSNWGSGSGGWSSGGGGFSGGGFSGGGGSFGGGGASGGW